MPYHFNTVIPDLDFIPLASASNGFVIHIHDLRDVVEGKLLNRWLTC